MHPIEILIEWLNKHEFKTEKNQLSEQVLCYLPNYPYKEIEGHDYSTELINYVETITLPSKICGTCFFIHVFLKNHFELFDLVDEIGTKKTRDVNEKFLLKESWDKLVKAGFNPDVFYDDLFQSIEHTVYGENK